MDRKGDVLMESFLNFIFAPIVIILLVGFFLIFLFFITDNKQEIVSIQTNTNTIRFLALLRSNTSIEGISGDYTISDLVVYSVRGKNYNLLEEEINKRMNKIYPNNKCPGSWRFEVDDFKGNRLFNTGKIRNIDLSIAEYKVLFLNTGVEIFVVPYKYKPVASVVTLPVDYENEVNLTLYVEC